MNAICYAPTSGSMNLNTKTRQTTIITKKHLINLIIKPCNSNKQLFTLFSNGKVVLRGKAVQPQKV